MFAALNLKIIALDNDPRYGTYCGKVRSGEILSQTVLILQRRIPAFVL